MKGGKLAKIAPDILFFLTATGLIFWLAAVFYPRIVLFDKYRGLIMSLEKTSNKEYAENRKCLDFSKDLMNNLEEDGVPAKIEIVKRNGIENEYHAVVSLQVDPQNGQMTGHEVVDSCVLKNGSLACKNGIIERGNIYVASETK